MHGTGWGGAVRTRAGEVAGKGSLSVGILTDLIPNSVVAGLRIGGAQHAFRSLTAVWYAPYFGRSYDTAVLWFCAVHCMRRRTIPAPVTQAAFAPSVPACFPAAGAAAARRGARAGGGPQGPRGAGAAAGGAGGRRGARRGGQGGADAAPSGHLPRPGRSQAGADQAGREWREGTLLIGCMLPWARVEQRDRHGSLTDPLGTHACCVYGAWTAPWLHVWCVRGLPTPCASPEPLHVG